MKDIVKICHNCLHFEMADLQHLRGRCKFAGVMMYDTYHCSSFALHPRFEVGDHEAEEKSADFSIQNCPCCGKKVISGVSVNEAGKFEFHITCTRCSLDKKLSATGITSLDKLASMLINFIEEWNCRIK